VGGAGDGEVVMVYAREVRPSSQNADGSLTYPGAWIELWFFDPTTGVHWLIGFRPKLPA
jgi:hypothetical protein